MTMSPTLALEDRCRRALLGSEEGRRHVAFFAAIPDMLLPWIVPFWWHRDRLFALELPILHRQMTELRPFLSVPTWRAGRNAGLFQLTGWDILANREKHADHWQRTMAADLRYPLTCYQLPDRLTLLDGYHRTLTAEATGVESLPIVIVPPEMVDDLLIRDGFLGELNAIRASAIDRDQDRIPTLRRVAQKLRAEHPEGTFPDW